MSNVNANINVNINASNALAQLRLLQNEISRTNRVAANMGGAAAAKQMALNNALMAGAQASGMFNARIVPVTDSVTRFSNALEKGKLSMGEYTRYAASQLPGMSRVFKKEFDTMQRVAETRVKALQTQYVALGKSAQGVQQAMALTPTALDMKSQATQTAMAAQRQMLFNKLIADGSTRLLNWGKNTQWAGRQLMVGFSVPLAIAGGAAAKFYMEIERAGIAFKRVYGDLDTSTQEVNKNLDAMKELGKEYTKYGIAVKDTIDVAARAAATGATNEGLMAATQETLRLATLGQIDYNQALEATISLQTAFGIANKDLGTNIDFLNAVENQTVLTLDDISKAIPRVAPVIKGLGGDVKDLAILMTALREGGVTAEQGANALKSGLASLINPTTAAQEALKKMGININEIVQANKGDLMGTVQDFAKALDTLNSFQRQQALEKVFGKYQYARLGALFKNINREGGQAQRVLELAGMSMQDLAELSEGELSKIEDSVATKFTAAIEKLKLAIAPVGEAFLKVVTPIVEFVTKLADKFNSLPDGVKNAIVVITTLIAGLGPIVIMGIGLIANGLANVAKVLNLVRLGFNKLRGSSKSLKAMGMDALEASAAQSSLEGKVDSLTSSMSMQQGAIQRLIALYGEMAGAARAAAASMPKTFPIPVGVPAGGAPAGGTRVSGPMGRTTMFPGVIRRNKGGIVPGVGNKDTVPALLTPGETVVNKKASQSFRPIIDAMNTGTLQMLANGSEPARTGTVRGTTTYLLNPGALMFPGNQTTFGMDKGLLSNDPEGIISKSVTGGIIGSSKIVAKEMGLIAENAKMSKSYFDRMNAVLGPTSAGIAADLQETFLAMQGTSNKAQNIDQVVAAAAPKINARLDDLATRGPEGRAMADAARRFIFFPASQQDLDLYADKRTLAARETQTGIKTTTERYQASPLQSPIESATKRAFEGRIPSGYQYSHVVSTPTLGQPIPITGSAMEPDFPEERRSSLIGALREYERTSPTVRTLQSEALTIGTQAGVATSQSYNAAVEAGTRDIYPSSRERKSPHPLVIADAKSDSLAYSNTVKQTIMSQPALTNVDFVEPSVPARQGAVDGKEYANAVKAAILTQTPAPALLPAKSPSERLRERGYTQDQINRINRKFGDRMVGGGGEVALTRSAKNKELLGKTATAGRQSWFATKAGAAVGSGIVSAANETRKTIIDGARTASRQSRTIFSDAVANFREGMQKEARRQQRRRQFGDIPVSTGAGRDTRASQMGRRGMVPGAQLPYLPRTMGKVISDGVAQTKAGFANTRSAFTAFGTSMQATTRVVGTQVRAAWADIPSKLETAKTATQKALRSTATAISTGSSRVRTALAEAATKIRTAAAGINVGGGAGGRGGQRIDANGNPVGRFGRLGSSLSGGAVGVGMGMSMASMLPFMMQDEEGKWMGMDANKAGMGMMFGGMGLSMLPMLMNPIGAVIAALGAAAAGIWFFNDQANALSANAQKMSNALIAGADTVNNVAKFYGTETIPERLRKKEFAEASGVGEKKLSQAEEFVASEAGTQMKEGLAISLQQLGTSAAAQQFAANLGSMILQGAITVKQAKGIAAVLGKELNNKAFSIKVTGELQEIVGADGRKITEDPLGVAINIDKQNVSTLEQLRTNIQGAAADLNEAYDGASTQSDSWLGALTRGINNFGSNLGASQQQLETVGGLVGNQLSQSYDNLTAAKDRYAKISKEISEIDDKDTEAKNRALAIQNREKRQLELITESINKQREAYVDLYNSFPEDGQSQSAAQGAMILGLEKSLSEAFADNPLMKASWESINTSLANMDHNIRFKIYADLASGALDPMTFQSMLALFKTPESASYMYLNIVQQLKGDAQLATGLYKALFATGLDQEAQITITTNMSGMNVKQATQYQKTLEEISLLSNEDLRKEVGITSSTKSAEDLKMINQGLENLNGLPPKLKKSIEADADTEMLQNFGTNYDIVQNKPNIRKKLEAKDEFSTTLQMFGLTYSEYQALDDISKSIVLTYVTRNVEMNLVETYKSAKAMAEGTVALANTEYGMVGRAGAVQQNIEAGQPNIKKLAKEGDKDTDKKTGGDTGAGGGGGGGGGGGTKELSPLQSLIKNLVTQAKLYRQRNATTKKLLQDQLAYKGMVAKLRSIGVPEYLIADWASQGEEGLKLANEFLDKNQKQQKRILRAVQRVSVGEQLARMRNERSEARLQTTARARLTESGITGAAREYAMEDEGLVRLIATLEKGSKAYNKLIESIKNTVNAYDEAISKNEEEIRQLEKRNEVAQDQIDVYNQDLATLAEQEDRIREAYQKRIDALDEVAQINDYIINQQKSQLDLADALSKGDISAAAKTAQQMQADTARFSLEQARQGLEDGLENLVKTLTIGGLNKEEIEKRIKQLEDETFQRNKLIRSLEKQNEQIEENRNAGNPPTSESDSTTPLTDQAPTTPDFGKNISYDEFKEYFKKLSEDDKQFVKNKIFGGKNKEKWQEEWKSFGDRRRQKIMDAIIDGNLKGDKNKFFAGGLVGGTGGGDLINALLTPGEFVVRKAAVDKFGSSMLSKINDGSFSMPSFAAPQPVAPPAISTGGTENSNVYNNNYEVVVNVSKTNVSPDDIANKVIGKIKQLEGSSIRRQRGNR